MSDLHDLKYKLARLQMAHKDLEDQIRQMLASPSPDLIRIQRLKKEKLLLKEQITKIEDELIPDIIA